MWQFNHLERSQTVQKHGLYQYVACYETLKKFYILCDATVQNMKSTTAVPIQIQNAMGREKSVRMWNILKMVESDSKETTQVQSTLPVYPKTSGYNTKIRQRRS